MLMRTSIEPLPPVIAHAKHCDNNQKVNAMNLYGRAIQLCWIFVSRISQTCAFTLRGHAIPVEPASKALSNLTLPTSRQTASGYDDTREFPRWLRCNQDSSRNLLLAGIYVKKEDNMRWRWRRRDSRWNGSLGNMRVMYPEVYFSRRNVGRPRRMLRTTFKKFSFATIY